MADPDTLLLRDLLRNLRDDCGHHDAPETREEAEAGLAALDRLEGSRMEWRAHAEIAAGRIDGLYQTTKRVRAELAESRATMRHALDLLDHGMPSAARRVLAHAVGLGEGPVYGGEE